MNNLRLIAAIGKNNELGKNNDLIWRVREDLQFFKQTTMGSYIVMGKNTYHSMPPSLLGRTYLVISEAPVNGIKTFGSINEFLKFAEEINETIWVVGGGMIYTQLLPHCSEMVLTEIDDTCSGADVFFPQFEKADWNTEIMSTHETYRRVRYTRK